MDRRQAIAQLNKATVDRPMVGDGLLQPSQQRAFMRTIKEKAAWMSAFQGTLTSATRSPTGVINKIATGTRLIRGATENADDGYRAQATFPTVPYSAKKIRLPFEVTEDAFHENISEEQLEATLYDEFTTQFANDLEDLAVNGDTAAGAGPDQAFLQIRDGILKRIATLDPSSVIDFASINSGAFDKGVYFKLHRSLPNRYRNQPGLEWVMSPNRASVWWESLTNRNTAAGDTLLAGPAGDSPNAPGAGAARGPLGIPIRTVPWFPDDKVLLASPRNFHVITTWDVRRRRITGETDAELAFKDKRAYVFFIKQDVIYEEGQALRLAENLATIV